MDVPLGLANPRSFGPAQQPVAFNSFGSFGPSQQPVSTDYHEPSPILTPVDEKVSPWASNGVIPGNWN